MILLHNNKGWYLKEIDTDLVVGYFNTAKEAKDFNSLYFNNRVLTKGL